MGLATLTIDDLAERCAEDTEKFFKHLSHESQHCFELFRRALAETQADAFTRIYQIYLPQVLGWIHHHPRFSQTNESDEYFANLALSKFYFALRGEKFQRFAELSQTLAYLKVCVHTAITQYLRKQAVVTMIDLEDAHIGTDPLLDRDLTAARIWTRVCELLPDSPDQLLADCVFKQDLKPAEIARLYPDNWPHSRDVSVALQRIRRGLRRDPELREWLGV
jgi:hypothetical protein